MAFALACCGVYPSVCVCVYTMSVSDQLVEPAISGTFYMCSQPQAHLFRCEKRSPLSR